MLVLLSQTDFTVECYYTYLSLFTLVTFYLNNSFVHSRKTRRKGIVPSIQFNVSDPASTSTSLLKTASCVLRLFGKVAFNRLRFQYPWVAQGSVISTAYCYPPSTFTLFAILLGPR